MKRLIALILVVMLLVPTVALASDVTTAKWYAIITASNENTAADDVFTIFSLGTQDLIDAGFLSANLTDCAMRDTSGIDTAFMPSVNATYPWCFYVNHIGENAFRNYLLYTGGNADMDGKIRYFPGAGGMTCSDNDTLELSDNFTIEQKGWVDTDNGTNKNLVYKQDAFRLYVSPTVSENITAGILGWSGDFTETLRPDGHNTCAIPAQSGCAACNDHYQCVDEAVADDATTYLKSNINDGAVYTDFYTLDSTSTNSTDNISEVKVYIRGKTLDSTGLEYFRGDLKLNGNTTTGTARWSPAANWVTFNEALARPGGGNWQQSDLDDLLIGVTIKDQAATTANTFVTQVYVVVTFQNSIDILSVTATGVESGEHTVKVAQGNTVGGHIYLGGSGDYVDCGDTDNLSAATKLSIEVWMKGTNPTLNSDFKTFASKYYHATAREWVFFTTRVGSYDEIKFFVYDQSTSALRGGKIPSTDNISIWDGVAHHIAVTWDGDISNPNTGITFYVDGVSANYADNSAGAFTAVEDTTQPVYIGRRGNLTTHDWRDYIDSVRIYNRELSAAEVAQHFIGTFTDESSVVGLWHFDENSGTIAFDASGENNDGELIGAALTRQVGNLSGQDNQALEIYVDGDLKDVVNPISVPDNSNGWTFFQNLDTYWHYHKIWIDGVLRQHIEYEYDDTVFSDLSGNSQDTTPTFRTASSDADVGAIMASFKPIGEAQAPAWVLGVERDFWDTEDITTTGEFTTTPTPTAAPGIDIIEAISAASGTPSQLPFNVIAGFVILAVSLTATWFLAKHGSRNLWLKIILITTCMAVCVAVRVFDFWMVVFFLIMAIAVALFSRQRSVV